jgi:protein-tyrosine phosphatase
MKVLMVCLGNICRSPIAEGVLQYKANLAGLQWVVDSAGTNGFHVGEAPHPLSQKVAKSNGIDISNQISRQFTREDFKNFDLIFAMADDVLLDMKRIGIDQFDDKKTSLFLDSLYPGKHKNVPDPWYGSEDGYIEVFEMINKGCDAIIQQYSTKENQ